jgi:hypothetical protein
MRELLSGDATEDDTHKIDGESTTSTPHWIKVFWIILMVLFVVSVIMMLFGGIEHGPGRHIKSEDASGQKLSIEQGRQQL